MGAQLRFELPRFATDAAASYVSRTARWSPIAVLVDRAVPRVARASIGAAVAAVVVRGAEAAAVAAPEAGAFELRVFASEVGGLVALMEVEVSGARPPVPVVVDASAVGAQAAALRLVSAPGALVEVAWRREEGLSPPASLPSDGWSSPRALPEAGVVEGLPCGADVALRLRTVLAGVCSAWTDEVRVRLPTKAPGPVRALRAARAGACIRLTWLT